MTQTITPKSYKRYCPHGHDTWVVGRNGTGQTCLACQKIKNEEKSERDKVARRALNRAEHVPGLKDYRQKKGYTLRQVAWESGLTKDTVWRIETQQQRANYQQRVKIFQAFNVLAQREMEAREEILKRERRMVCAGLR